jgi:hypothetical protein
MKALFEMKGRPRPTGPPPPSRLVHVEVPDAETAVRLEDKLRSGNSTIGVAAAGGRFALRSVHEGIDEAGSYAECEQMLADAAL